MRLPNLLCVPIGPPGRCSLGLLLLVSVPAKEVVEELKLRLDSIQQGAHEEECELQHRQLGCLSLRLGLTRAGCVRKEPPESVHASNRDFPRATCPSAIKRLHVCGVARLRFPPSLRSSTVITTMYSPRRDMTHLPALEPCDQLCESRGNFAEDLPFRILDLKDPLRSITAPLHLSSRDPLCSPLR